MTADIRVLVVDDTPDIRMLLTAALGAMQGFEPVGEASDGEEAVALATELQPDAVLLDLAMPVMDGLQAAPLIRERSPQSRIIILSGFSKDRLGAEALAVGADEYIEKGTSPKKIAEIIRTVCGTPRPDPEEPPERTAPEDVPVTEPPPPGGIEAWRRRIAMAVEHVGELAGAFSSFGRTVRTRVDFDRAGFALSETGGFRIAAICGPDHGTVPVGTLVPMLSEFTTTLDDGRTITIDDTRGREEGPLDMYLFDRGVRSYAAVPIRAAGRAQALVSFASERPGAFPRGEVDYLESAVREAATAFHMLWAMSRPDDAAASAEADNARREWNRIIRHDLRSPLTVISGFAETMRVAWPDLPEEKKLDFVDAIARGAAAMTSLLSDIDQVDRLESGVGALDQHPVKLCAIVDQTTKDLMASKGRVIRTTIAPDLPFALADEHDMRRVLSNLLENAFKFSDEAEPVDVDICASGGMIHVTVTDRGIGIPQADQPTLFDKFSRGTQAHDRPKVPGTGLGLYICRSIVEAHGGRIWVESEPGAGAAFHYTVPAAVLPDAAAS